jgi:putative Mn2+ efflux pump MntP
MLGLWVAAAFLLFLGARAGARFLRERRGARTTFWRILWPLETLIHFSAALGITLLAPALLARLAQIELTTLRFALVLGMIDLVLVPALGVLAYTYMFGDFLDLYREARGAEAPPAPPESAPGEA